MQELYNNYFNILDDKIWKVAIYARLSREDEKDEKYKGQSESIENQIKYLKSIVSAKGWILVDIYKDDGYTGTNFDRPDFIRMIKDIENGIVNMVIVKDLSRLGRNTNMVLRYYQEYFPSRGVRFITATQDNIDTFYNEDDDLVSFKAVISELYPKDISKKIKSVKIAKAKQGLFQ